MINQKVIKGFQDTRKVGVLHGGLRGENTPKEDTQARDPRIESPNIRVVYPAEDTPVLKNETVQTNETAPQNKETDTPVQTTQTQTSTEGQTETHTCSLSWQQALKQHATLFGLTALLILGLGYIIGKSK